MICFSVGLRRTDGASLAHSGEGSIEVAVKNTVLARPFVSGTWREEI